MDDSTDKIHQEMEETRNSLKEKLETLEQQVKDTVHEATETVSTVKETVEAARETIQETATAVKETVHDTVGSVKETVADTVESVKESLNLEHQVQRHPWAMFAGAMVAGYIGGRMLIRATSPASHAAVASGMSTPTPPVSPVKERPAATQHNGHGHRDGGTRKKAATAAMSETGGLWSTITEHFGPELTKLKGLAIGVAGNVVREMVTAQAPPPVAERLLEVVNSMTEKLGGKPMEGSLLDNLGASFGKGASDETHGAEVGGSMGAAQREGQADLGRFDRR